MRPYTWVYLCSDPNRLRLTLDFLPRDKPFEDLESMDIAYLSHLDPVERADELRIAANYHAPSWLQYRVVDLSATVRLCPPNLMKYFATDKARWSLGVKLLFPLVYGALLYTDDDVIVPQDPRRLLGYQGWGSKGCFRFAGKKTAIAQQLFDVFEIQRFENTHPAYEANHYDASAMDAGVWFDPGSPKDKALWAYYLQRLADADYIKTLTTRNLELRCLDQRFLTMFSLKRGWTPFTIGNGFAPPKSIRPSFFDKKYFFHYKSSSKAAWQRVLREHHDGTR